MQRYTFIARTLVVVGLGFAGAGFTLAHHSFGAEYDETKPLTVTGTLDVKDEKGIVVNWKFEGYAPNTLNRLGWKRDVTMKVGDTITVFAWRARDGSAWAHSRQITLPNGTKMFFGPPAGTGDGGNAPPIPKQ